MTTQMEVQGSVANETAAPPFTRLRGFHRRKGKRNIKSKENGIQH